jgi:rubrerythrin
VSRWLARCNARQTQARAGNPLLTTIRISHVDEVLHRQKPGFGLERYLHVAGATRPEAFDWQDPGPPLDEEALFCLGYMMDIESHTIIYLRELLATRVAEDVEVTSFLSCWAYEEFFHSKVLERLLEAHGVTIDGGRFARLRRRQPGDRARMRMAQLLARITRHFSAVHMTWGAINEISTLIGYQALIARCGNPLVTTVLARIIKDERRHYSFYFHQARDRLKSRVAQVLTAFIVRNFWSPVGSPVRGNADAARICRYLFDDDQGPTRLTRIDNAIARLPGLAWFSMGSSLMASASVSA